MLTYSNPRLRAEIDGWPAGYGRETTSAVFYIEANKHGERAGRVTTGKPRFTTYAPKMRIVDGSDGKTYLIALTNFGFVSIMRGDLKIQHESIHERDPRFAEVRALFE